MVSVTAVDLSPQVVAIAHEQVAGYSEIEVLAGNRRHLPFRAGSYHAAVCSLTLHHLGERRYVSSLLRQP